MIYCSLHILYCKYDLIITNIFFSCSTEPVENKELCVVTLQTKEIEQLREAIEDLYYFEFVLGTVTMIS